MKVGDRVRIDEPHPWAGSSGTIVRKFSFEDLCWVVRLDREDGHEVATSEDDLRVEA